MSRINGYWAVEVLQEGRLMGWMNKFTLLRTFAIGIGGKVYEIEDQDRYLMYLIRCF